MLLARTTTKSGDDVLVIGLSKENRKRLDDGQPIDISTYTHGDGVPKELHLLIFAGLDEDSMQEELRSLMGKDTVVQRDAGKPRGAAE